MDRHEMIEGPICLSLPPFEYPVLSGYMFDLYLSQGS